MEVTRRSEEGSARGAKAVSGEAGSGPTDLAGELMVRYQAGDVEAFKALYDVLEPRLRAYLTSLTLNRTTADDMVQDTFLELHRSRHTYLPDRPVYPWALAIARHVFLKTRRATGRRKKLETFCAVPDVLFRREIGDLADQDYVESALAELRPEQRESLLLHHLLGLSFAEIAGVLGIRRGTARVRAHRGMNELRTILRREDGPRIDDHGGDGARGDEARGADAEEAPE